MRDRVENQQYEQEMYNLTVEDAHTFFVGDEQWLVHNDCYVPRNLREPLREVYTDHPSNIFECVACADESGAKFKSGGMGAEIVRIENKPHGVMRGR